MYEEGRQNMTEEYTLRQTWLRAGMQGSRLHEPATATKLQTPILDPQRAIGPHSPEMKAVVVINNCDKNVTGECDPFSQNKHQLYSQWHLLERNQKFYK